MKREISDEVLASLEIDSAKTKALMEIVHAAHPKDKPVEFWDGALWALMHFAIIKDEKLPSEPQMIGFALAVAASYKQALDNNKWELPE